jgi:hypothetical protein
MSLFILWPAVIIQFLLYVAFFVKCWWRGQDIGLRFGWFLLIAGILGRVADWEILVLPLVALVMAVVSERATTLSERTAKFVESKIEEERSVPADPETWPPPPRDNTS